MEALSPEALSALMAHKYPGNIRELENIVEHAFVVCRQGTIDLHHLPPDLLPAAPRPQPPVSLETTGAKPLSAVLATERNIIWETLEQSGFNRHATARRLGMHKSTLYRKMKKLGISLPEKDGRSMPIPTTSVNSG